MTLIDRRWRDDRGMSRFEDSFWESDRWYRDWDDWPRDWPRPGDLVRRVSLQMI
ncbi:unnamed protein product [Gongylonema pulchrum]|uniref:SAM-dependent methyltransferase n=1 Tax=Gongylonema pulchrum TaxID=637853 RepID=A0A183E337_9BILA|nr:unnamed protein product [Gongylonema pulchrum]